MSSRLASRRIVALLLVGFTCGLLSFPDRGLAAEVAAEGDFLRSIGGDVAAIFAKCRSAVVRIEASDAYGEHSGTGFFIDPNGTIYTHYSVGGSSWNLTVTYEDKRYPATCLLADPFSGVTLLKIEAAPTPFLSIGRSEDLAIASPLVAIGYPLDHPAAPSFGLIGAFEQRLPQGVLVTTHIRANLAVQPGEQGAPLLNTRGEAVGILVCRLDLGAACLVLPMRAAEKVRRDFMRFGEPHQGWIGATVRPLEANLDGPLCFSELERDAPVAKCGIKMGDQLVQIGHTPIERPGDLRDASFFLTADDAVPIVVRRNDELLTFEVRAVRPPWMAETARNTSPNTDGMRLSMPHSQQ